MPSRKGIIALMGSGELSGTMVEVHKELFSGLPPNPKTFFLDTPAGFELNADLISQKAVNFFKKNVQQSMSVISYKGKKFVSELNALQSFQKLRIADFVLVGPGSPTYALNEWRETPIPQILIERIEQGSCLVAASAAALTLGRYTIPVYEIYKVGQEPHWVEGMNILDHFGFNLVVIPHWNNSEGKSHDTRFCFMGENRLKQLEILLPEDVGILGLDEHTACLLDLEKEQASIRGIGGVTLRHKGQEKLFQKGDRFPLSLLQEGAREKKQFMPDPSQPESTLREHPLGENREDQGLAIEQSFRQGLEHFEVQSVIQALLDYEQWLWKIQENSMADEFLLKARNTFRKMIVALGTGFGSASKNSVEALTPLVEGLLKVRERFRQTKQFEAADTIRKVLEEAGIIVEDTREGTRWRLK